MGLPSIYTTKRQCAFDVLKLREKAPIEPQIDSLINRYIHSLGSYLHPKAGDLVPGAAVMVRKNNEVVHLNCYGYANLETKKEITTDTLFDLGSLSKQFTAIAVLNLVISKELKRKAKLSKFFADFPRYSEHVTVDDLIHHTSAIPEYIDIHDASREVDEDWYPKAMKKSDDWYPQMAKRSEEGKEITNKDVLGWIASQRLLPRKPNTEFNYSNSGYVLLAELVEKVAGEPLAAYLKKRIFDPLEMNSTYVFDETSAFAEDAPEVVNHARCYNRVSGEGFVPVGYTPLNFVYGDGNVQSNIVDLAKWDAHLHRLDHASICSRYKEDEEADNKVRDFLWSSIQTKSRRRINYGAGWNLLRHEYEKTVEENGKRVTRKYESHGEYHRGEWLGWRSYIARGARWVVPKRGKDIDPDTWESLGIVVLSNCNQFNIDFKVQQISEVFWGSLKKDNIIMRFY